MNKEKPNYYAIIPSNVRYDKSLQIGARLLYGEITALSNNNGHCWAGDKYFMDLYEVSKRTIQNWLKSLEDNGYIKREVTYKKDSKEIEKRYISILVQNTSYPYGKKLHDPMEEICTDSITSINTTSNNNKNIVRFEEFWELYPKKTNKAKAKVSFNNHVTDEKTFNLVMEDLEQRVNTKQWQDKQYIPHATTYLNGKRWEDELGEMAKVKTKSNAIMEFS